MKLLAYKNFVPFLAHTVYGVFFDLRCIFEQFVLPMFHSRLTHRLYFTTRV